MTSDHKTDMVSQAAQATPSLAIIAAYLKGLPVEKWAAFAGLLFILLQMGYLIWKWRRDIRRERQRETSLPPLQDTDNAAL